MSETLNTESTENLDNKKVEGQEWYIVQVLSGYENKVLKSLKERIVNHKLTEAFSEIIIPEETLQSNANGKKRTYKKKVYPGYILLKMNMNNYTWQLVRKTENVKGFIGGTPDKPLPLSEEEAMMMTNQVADGFKRSKSSLNFSEGDSVKVIEGPFASFVGTIEAVNEKGKIRVQVSIFGRPTPVELDFSQIEKV